MSNAASPLKKILPGIVILIKILPRPIQVIAILAVIVAVFIYQYSSPSPSENQTPTPTPSSRSTPPQSTGSAVTTSAQVIRVIDGDTIMISQNNQEDTVRLIGVNTPEVVDPRQPQQCYGQEASAKAKQLAEGQLITLESNPTQGDRDMFGRLLRYVFLANNTHLNLQLIAEGYAFEYTYRFPYKYQTEFKAAQLQAQTTEAGLWNPNTCNGEK